MGNFFDTVGAWFAGPQALAIVWAAALLVIGIGVARAVSVGIGRVLEPRASAQTAMIVQRLVRYGLVTVVVIVALRRLGVELGVLVGAAGILTVALGFASQTSASNLISGLFLMGEQPFVVGDVIQVQDTTGEVIGIDLLSVKLRTFDNLLVRIPNESLLKAELTNLTHFPIRRLDMPLRVAYHQDIGELRALLFEVADQNPLCLDEPAPLFIFKGFGESALIVQFSVWAARETFITTRNAIYEDLALAFQEAGIEPPFPQRRIHFDPAPPDAPG